MATLVGSHGRVFAFEPDSDNVRVLTENVMVNRLGNVVVEAMAVSSTTGDTQLFVRDFMKANGRIFDPGDGSVPVAVKSTSLDDYFRYSPSSVATIDFIKMDIEGGEFMALQGMRNLLSQNHHISLASEFWPRGLEASGSSGEAYLVELEAYGFKLHKIDDYSGRLIPTDISELLQRYLPETSEYTNLWCCR